MMETEKSLRLVYVNPLSAKKEAFFLLAAIGVVIALMGLRFYAVNKAEGRRSALQPFQQKDLFLKNQAPAMYRALCSVASDILDIYQQEGIWPDVTELQQEELPPFSKEFLPSGLKGYVWSRYIGPGRVDYFGINKQTDGTAKKVSDPLQDSFILRIIDLQNPGHPYPVSVNKKDQKERFTTQVWIYPGPRNYPPAGNLVATGWKWILSASDIADGKNRNVVESPGKTAETALK